MPTHNIRENFPHNFAECPKCGKKGFYAYQGHARIVRKQIVGHPPGKRCKYCRHFVEAMPITQFLAQFDYQLKGKSQ